MDITIAMSETILGIGNMSASQMQAQSEKLKKTQKNLKKIEKSAIPGLDRMMGLIKSVELRNRIIIAFVIALCLAFFIYAQFLKPVVELSASMTEPINPKGIRTSGGASVQQIPGEQSNSIVNQ